MTTHTIDNNVLTVVLDEPSLRSTNVEFLRVICEGFLAKPDWTDFFLDLTPVKQIDSAGMNLVAKLYGKARTHKGKATIKVCKDGRVHQTFQFTRFERQPDLFLDIA